MEEKRIAWAITGAGHTLGECIEVLFNHDSADLFISRAAEEVVRVYGLAARLRSSRIRMYRDEAASAPAACRFSSHIYNVLVVAPATANSVAKFVHGISDTLVTNMFAQAGKARIPVVVYPTDLEPEMDSCGPRGEPIKVYPRSVDLENTRKISEFDGVKVVRSLEELEQCLAACL
ncbi:MAG: flavoprotein [Acidobacteriota bacterium]